MSLRQILQFGDTFYYFFHYFVDWIMRKEKGGKRGRKTMDEREKERKVKNRKGLKLHRKGLRGERRRLRNVQKILRKL